MNDDMNFEVLKSTITTLEKINENVATLILHQPGTMNIIELMDRSHLENQNSNIIAYLLDPKEAHHHPEYGKIFLDHLSRSGIAIKSNKIVSIEKEKVIIAQRRIDILILTEKDVIIIENKIYANDQKEQLDDYVKWAQKNYCRLMNDYPVVVYLSLYGDDPSAYSLSDYLKKLLQKENKYINLSYKNEILDWLSSLSAKCFNEIELQSAIIQYIDLLKGLTRQRVEDKMVDQNYAIGLLNEYKDFNRNQLLERIDIIQKFNDNISLIVYIDLISESYNSVNETIIKNNALYYVHRNIRIPNRLDWINAIKADPNDFGIEFVFDIVQNNSFLVCFENFSASSKVFVGIRGSEPSSNGVNNEYFEIFDHEFEGQEHVLPHEGWLKTYAINGWFLNAVLYRAGGRDWEKKHGAVGMLIKWINIFIPRSL